jgi:predicted nucleic acid-binding protein
VAEVRDELAQSEPQLAESKSRKTDAREALSAAEIAVNERETAVRTVALSDELDLAKSRLQKLRLARADTEEKLFRTAVEVENLEHQMDRLRKKVDDGRH